MLAGGVQRRRAAGCSAAAQRALAQRRGLVPPKKTLGSTSRNASSGVAAFERQNSTLSAKKLNSPWL
jgi:hypothetical protein